MSKIRTTDMRISKLISSLTNYVKVDADGEVIDESTNIVLKDNPAACQIVFNAMKRIILEECDLFFDNIDLEIIEKNDKIMGRYNVKDSTIQVVIEDETNMAIVNTMAHELRHAFQHYNGFLDKSFKQKNLHSKVVEDYMYGLTDFPTTEEHVREVLYRTSWHEIDARRYARWFTAGGIGDFKETESFDINEDNIGKELISQLLKMGETGTFGN